MVGISARDLPKAMRPARTPKEPCPKCGHRICTCLEDDFFGQIRQKGLPQPVRQHRFAAPARQWRYDLAYPSVKVAIDIDGGTWIQGAHVRGAGVENDCEKHNLAALKGWLVIRCTTDMIADGRALTYVERALRVRGMPTEAPLPTQEAFKYPPR
jgi:very-short-patch-repair endonuclease